MKRYINCIWFVLLGLATSCTSLLEKEPISTSNAETFYKTVDDVELTLMGTYSALQAKGTYSGNIPVLMNTGTDEALYSRPYNSWTTSYYQHTSSTEDIRMIWRDLYFGISQANSTLTGLSIVEGDVERKTEIEAEARTLRALFYLDLVRFFENVPLILTPTTDIDNLYPSQAEPMEVYKQIIEDLQFGTAHLKWGADVQAGRVSNALAHGVLSRVYLDLAGEQMAKYSDISKDECYKLVVAHSDSVINNGYHTLNSDYPLIFKNLAKNIYETREVIFQIGFQNMLADGLSEGGQHGNLNGPSTNFNNQTEPFAYAFQFTTIMHVNAYEHANIPDVNNVGLMKDTILDQRYTWNIGNFKYKLEDSNDPTSKKAVAFLATAEKNKNEYYPGKFRRVNHNLVGFDADGEPIYDVSTLEVGAIAKNETNIDFPYMRYAEIFLNKAEAEYELGNLDAAKLSLNKIRNRAGLEDYALNNDRLQSSIRDERMRELCYEGFRKKDLIRWGILADRLHELKEQMLLSDLDPASGKYFLFRASDYVKYPKHSVLPIPNREITNNPNLVQHTYWQ
ncbi:RagB/SusD family nutrient uptake outer membrane protein [Flammeovirga kamogawensis]|uniref:RagB/SusD family nutrient uptake outer membrane protein n=1 Tax=Flammeovirga kamogawensis TaxID=373891 RepID=A0ABX8H3N3_9BACT|nr:RagB/SusD family nutrient uptake outer membrane protein [Flammeovirga kamogawensis]MBB6461876.1 hypothetical protein [Flammeovirga kamogawensis]QWG10510.1 RagB/SusD family nutrient uptake outer membrane protein [Flammeovirga kamogawensis]TRX63619.1 RagB/SusD family nutrient uptake outer membrane protein [Flammeovirga kamogawensis]